MVHFAGLLAMSSRSCTPPVKMTVPFDILKAIFTCKHLTSRQLVLGFCHVFLMQRKWSSLFKRLQSKTFLIACRQRGAQRVLPAEPDGYFSKLGDHWKRTGHFLEILEWKRKHCFQSFNIISFFGWRTLRWSFCVAPAVVFGEHISGIFWGCFF